MQASGSALRSKLGSFADIPNEEWRRLDALESRGRKAKMAGDNFVDALRHRKMAYILQRGWVITSKLLSNGNRQVISLHVPGDFIALNSIFLRNWDQSVTAITDSIISEISMVDIADLRDTAPRLSGALFWAMWRDKALSEERLVDLGKRTALERTAHFLLELRDRLRPVGLGTEFGYPCPISQPLLADILGITPIHLNRVLRELREGGCLTFRGGHVSFDNLPRLVEFAEYDPVYLDQDLELCSA